MSEPDPDGDSALLWQGPLWRAGGVPSPTAVPGWPQEVDAAAEDFAAGAGPLPCAVVIDLTAYLPDAGLARIGARIAGLAGEVPVVVLCAGDSPLAGLPRAHAIVEAAIPPDALFRMLCALQRAILRAEEARIRRIVFGRLPDYGSAPHHQGTSGLLVVGLGRRFADLDDARRRNVEIVGAFTADMAETYLSQRAFDAAILDTSADEAAYLIERILRDPRFARLPILAFCDAWDDIAGLFRAGANDVFHGAMTRETLAGRLAAAIRLGKRRRLADRLLAESRIWLLRKAAAGGISQSLYDAYLARARQAVVARGLDLAEMRLTTEAVEAASLAGDLAGTILSIADATSREEDLVCAVEGRGPVAVFKNEQAGHRLRARIDAILGRTAL
ncbi:hypothetical protein [Polymorphum gilvum]|uniref:Uncharacterized protein n=1 Tax=Polymorphum gilvum (strain LMG 25793 / CGMCC 1.9160 / SL003B-26A1) TaxID=991905 RepID=F2IZT3_POLGS|nr:hypothetical protein [Polymorphum gilvum]ADZ70659.1 hypothetical protein SL003B_2234 [Polymorphum gilvum SL003B-26A1]